jgi:hypothetical protein
VAPIVMEACDGCIHFSGEEGRGGESQRGWDEMVKLERKLERGTTVIMGLGICFCAQLECNGVQELALTEREREPMRVCRTVGEKEKLCSMFGSEGGGRGSGRQWRQLM